MAKRELLLLLLGAVLSCAQSYSGPTAEDMQKINEIANLYSPSVHILTNDNYTKIFDGNDWAVLFCKKDILKCKLINLPWIHVAEEVANGTVSIAKAELNKDSAGFFHTMGIRDAPSILYISGGYIYNYTGLTEWRALESLITEKSYLQFDRVPIQKSLFRQVSLAIGQVFKVQKPGFWALEIIGILVFLAWRSRDQKPLKSPGTSPSTKPKQD